jgi:hypothetical protein
MGSVHLFWALDTYIGAAAFFVSLLTLFIRRLAALVEAVARLFLTWSFLLRVIRAYCEGHE